jgi:hypothetical protein
MSEQKWAEFSYKIEHLVGEYKKIKKERDELIAELEEFKKQTTKLGRGSKGEVLLKDRMKFLEEERGIVREKVKKLLKILREKNP